MNFLFLDGHADYITFTRGTVTSTFYNLLHVSQGELEHW